MRPSVALDHGGVSMCATGHPPTREAEPPAEPSSPTPSPLIGEGSGSPSPKRRSLRRAIVIGASLGLVMALGMEVLRVMVGSNLHVVVPGACYRSAQLSPSGLARVVRRLHIRTVINLRGPNIGEMWYDEETDAIRELGIKKVDVKLSGYG